MKKERYNIFSLGYNRYITKNDSFYNEIAQMANAVENGVNPAIIGSGDMSGNYDLVDGHFRSANFVSGSAGWQISADGDAEFNSVTVRGTIYATLGEIGGFTIGVTTLYSDGDEIVLDSANKRIEVGADDAIVLDGTNKRITVGASNEIIIDGANKKIESGNYVSGYAGAGFHLSEDLLEVANIACRGLIRTSVFQKDVISTVGGNLMVLDGDVLDADMDATDAETLTTKATTTFSVGDILRIKDGTDDEWLEVTAVNGAVYTCNRDKKGDYGAGANPTWKKGATVVNYRQSGDGGVYMTASESNAPYLSVFTHAGSPWTDLTTRLRIGNLNGYLGYSADSYGIGIGSSSGNDANLVFDPTNGIRLRQGTTNKITLDNAGNVIATGTINATAGKFGTATNYWNITATGIVAVTADTDCYIAGGAGLDYANWHADKGFLMGIDYSDSNVAKFFVGDDANNKYLKFDGTNTDATGLRYVEVFTCGEDIVDGNVVCVKPSYTDLSATTQDTYAREADPTVVYGGAAYETLIQVGQEAPSKRIWTFIQFDMTYVESSEKILKAEVVLTKFSYGGSTRNINIGVITASWDESTLTWNNKPTYTPLLLDTASYSYSGGNTLTVDITHLVRNWKAGNITNYGIMVYGGVNGDYVNFHSSEAAASANRPKLRITSSQTSDGNIYKANADDYLTCKGIIGVATETITSGNDCKIQTQGQLTNLDFGSGHSGSRFYLSTTDGGIVYANTNLNRMIMIGKSTSRYNAILNIDDKDILVEKKTGLTFESTDNNGRIYVPGETRYVLLDMVVDDNLRTQIPVKLMCDTDGYDDITIKDWDGSSSQDFRVAWGTNYFEIKTGRLLAYYAFT